MTRMTERQARALAKQDRHWSAVQFHGGWYVWSAESAHVVEFDARDVEAAGQEAEA